MTHPIAIAREDQFAPYLPALRRTYRRDQQALLDWLETSYPFDGECSTEDALDQETVPFEFAGDALAYQRYAVDLGETDGLDDCPVYERCVLRAPVGQLREGLKAYEGHFAPDWDEME